MNNAIETNLQSDAAMEKDFLLLQGTDHVEFYVGNAKQAAIII